MPLINHGSQWTNFLNTQLILVIFPGFIHDVYIQQVFDCHFLYFASRNKQFILKQGVKKGKNEGNFRSDLKANTNFLWCGLWTTLNCHFEINFALYHSFVYFCWISMKFPGFVYHRISLDIFWVGLNCRVWPQFLWYFSPCLLDIDWQSSVESSHMSFKSLLKVSRSWLAIKVSHTKSIWCQFGWQCLTCMAPGTHPGYCLPYGSITIVHRKLWKPIAAT